MTIQYASGNRFRWIYLGDSPSRSFLDAVCFLWCLLIFIICLPCSFVLLLIPAANYPMMDSITMKLPIGVCRTVAELTIRNTSYGKVAARASPAPSNSPRRVRTLGHGSAIWSRGTGKRCGRLPDGDGDCTLRSFISSCSMGRRSGFRTCRTNIEQRTGTTPRSGKGARLLSVGLDQGVVLVKHFGRPLRRRHLHQPIFGLARIRTLVNEAEPLSHAQVMTINTDRASSQCAEVHHRSARFCSDTIEAFQPGTDLICTIALQKIERKPATALSDLF